MEMFAICDIFILKYIEIENNMKNKKHKETKKNGKQKRTSERRNE